MIQVATAARAKTRCALRRVWGRLNGSIAYCTALGSACAERKTTNAVLIAFEATQCKRAGGLTGSSRPPGVFFLKGTRSDQPTPTAAGSWAAASARAIHMSSSPASQVKEYHTGLGWPVNRRVCAAPVSAGVSMPPVRCRTMATCWHFKLLQRSPRCLSLVLAAGYWA